MNTDEIRAALAAATPGPWDATYDPADRWTSITGQQYGEYVCPEVATCEGDVGTDAHLIANAPTYIADLLAEVDRLRALTSPRKAEAMASLVKASTRLVQIERDDARARAEAAEQVMNEHNCGKAAEAAYRRAVRAEQAVQRVRDLAAALHREGREMAGLGGPLRQGMGDSAVDAAARILRALDGGA